MTRQEYDSDLSQRERTAYIDKNVEEARINATIGYDYYGNPIHNPKAYVEAARINAAMRWDEAHGVEHKRTKPKVTMPGTLHTPKGGKI